MFILRQTNDEICELDHGKDGEGGGYKFGSGWTLCTGIDKADP